MLPSTLHIMTYPPAKFEVATSKSLGEDAFTRKTLFDLDPKVNITQNVAQYPLHHVTYAPAKFCSCYIPQIRQRCIYKKIHYLAFDLGFKVI